MNTRYGTRAPGEHIVMPRNGLHLRAETDRTDGIRSRTLTAARKAAKPGDAIVRCADRQVVSVK